MSENPTPKEKAVEMIKKFQSFKVSIIYKDFDGDTAIATDTMIARSASECAIIGVRWIIDRLSALANINKMEISYWESVIVELQKI
jgi:hypothetical protein